VKRWYVVRDTREVAVLYELQLGCILRAIVGVGRYWRVPVDPVESADRLHIGLWRQLPTSAVAAASTDRPSLDDVRRVVCSTTNSNYVAGDPQRSWTRCSSLEARRQSVRQWRTTRYSSVMIVRELAEPRHDQTRYQDDVQHDVEHRRRHRLIQASAVMADAAQRVTGGRAATRSAVARRRSIAAPPWPRSRSCQQPVTNDAAKIVTTALTVLNTSETADNRFRQRNRFSRARRRKKSGIGRVPERGVRHYCEAENAVPRAVEHRWPPLRSYAATTTCPASLLSMAELTLIENASPSRDRVGKGLRPGSGHPP